MKKLFLMFMAAIITAMSLTGCSGSKSKDGFYEPWEKTKNLKPTTLTICFPLAEKSETKEVLNELEKRAKDKLNVSLEFKCFPGNSMESKVRNMIDEGKPIDAMVLNIYDVKPFIELNQLADLTKLLPQYAPGLYASYQKEQFAQATFDGKIIGIPPNTMPYAPRFCAYVREDLMKKYGFETIKGIDDYNRYLSAVKKGEQGVVPVYSRNYIMSINLANAFDYSVVDNNLGIVYKRGDKNMRLIPWEQTPAFKNLTTMFLTWKNQGYINFNSGNQGQVDENDMTSGKYASIIDYYSSGRQEYYNNMLRQKGLKWKYTEVELFPGAKYDKSYSSYQFISINSKSPDKERMLMFLEWIQSDIENYKLLLYGIEGKHYKWDPKTGPKLLSDTNDTEDYMLAYMGWQGLNVFHNVTLDAKLTERSEKSYSEYLKEMDKYSEFPAHLGFSYDQNEIYETANKFDPPRMRGSIEYRMFNNDITVNDIDTYINYQKPTAEKVVAELQSKLDQWRSKNK